MKTRPDRSQRIWTHATAWLFAGALSAAAIAVAVADDSQNFASPSQPPPAAGSLPAQPPPAGNAPGFLHQLEVWWKDGFGNFDSKMKDAQDKLNNQNQATQEALQNAAKATKDAATAVTKLPSTRMFELRERCMPAPNGAPDCETAATKACNGRGFTGGNPLGVSSEQVCSPKALLSGNRPGPADCHDETYLLGVVCQ
jgi:hypothetical protein